MGNPVTGTQANFARSATVPLFLTAGALLAVVAAVGAGAVD